MSTQLVKKQEQDFEPAWRKILSDGHVWVERLNVFPSFHSFAPLRVKIAGVAAVALLIVGGILFTTTAPATIGKLVSMVGGIGAQEKQDDVVLEHRIQEMLNGAVSDGSRAKLYINKEYLLKHREDPKDYTIPDLVNEIVEAKITDGYEEFPEIGQPWPSGGPILIRRVGSETWVGLRLESPRGDMAWLGVIRKVGDKNTLYWITGQSPGAEKISPLNIPRAVIAAGFGKNVSEKSKAEEAAKKEAQK